MDIEIVVSQCQPFVMDVGDASPRTSLALRHVAGHLWPTLWIVKVCQVNLRGQDM